MYRIIQFYIQFISMQYTHLIILICIVLGVKTLPAKNATESSEPMIVTPSPSNSTGESKALPAENLSNHLSQVANEIINIMIRADCDKWNEKYGKFNGKFSYFYY